MSALKRPVQPMPDALDAILISQGLRDAYDARPAYQRNDWLAWIARAKKPETREKRIASMLGELAQGHGYMGMAWNPKA